MRRITTLIVVLIFAFSLAAIFRVSAQTDLEKERTKLEAELELLEREIRRSEMDITRTEAEKESLRYQISIIENKVNNLTYQIHRNNLIISDLGLQIGNTEDSIYRTTLKINDSQEKLGDVLRTMYREERKSLLFILLMEEDLSSFFNNLTLLERLSTETKSVLDQIKDLRSSLQGQKVTLSGEKEEVERIARVQALQRAEEEIARIERERLYGLTEEEYQKQLQEKRELEARAEEIRSRIFQLVGIPEAEMPTFGEALDLAKWVQGITGVRPALLLSIITQESRLGRNVGQCYITDRESGTARNINNGQPYNRGIHPTRDLPVFLDIIMELGRTPEQTPISCYIPMCYQSGTGRIISNIGMNSSGNPNCPTGYVPFGFGGAMGPAQFIPSTWQSVRPELTVRLGRPSDPWRINDSFLAAGILLRDNGAATNELNAAARYFGTAGIGYESAVMQRAFCIQTFINDGTMTSDCSRLVFVPN